MLNPKYDENNYIKHLAVPVITDSQKINQFFSSSLLRVKWFHQPLNKQAFDPNGFLRVHVKTPFGKLKPVDYRCNVDLAKDTYIQFIQLSPLPEFSYEIEIISPVGMTRSMVEIWEYIPSQTPTMSGFDSPVNILVDTASIVSAINQDNDDKSAITVAESQSSVITGTSAGTLPSNTGLIIAANPLTSEVMLVNPTVHSIKIFAAMPAIGASYSSLTQYTAELVGKNSKATLSSPTCKGAFYALANNAGCVVNITRTSEVLSV